MAPPESVLALARELTDAGADWQLHAHGRTMHAFTNPAANDPAFGTVYDADADRRSRAACLALLDEALGMEMRAAARPRARNEPRAEPMLRPRRQVSS